LIERSNANSVESADDEPGESHFGFTDTSAGTAGVGGLLERFVVELRV
jgi:hypothetical protein